MIRLLTLALLLAFAARAQPVATTPPAPTAPLPRTELIADHLDMSSTDTETRAILTGNVMLTGTNLKIVADRLEILAARVPGQDDTLGTPESFKYLLATGNVRIVQGEREATCGRAEVLPREEKVILTEDPMLIDRSSDFVAAGAKITLLRGQRQVLVEQPRLSGPPVKDLGPGTDSLLDPQPAK
jgi:lipopolysaccharide export system protein LptA